MTPYELTPEERGVLTAYNMQALNAKAAIHDLQLQLDARQKELATAQACFAGSLQLIATAQDIAAAEISPDFARLTSR